jgi:hypothetical protein
VLCSFILSSPLFCFLTSIKSRPFSNYQVTVFIKIWIINFEILNMKSGPRFTAHHSLLISALGLIKFSIQWLWSIATNPSLELTFKCGFDTIFQKKNHSATGSQSPVYQFTSPQLSANSYQSTTHHSLLIAALGLVEFSIQWLWSIATNPSLELTGTTHHSLITKIH